MKQYGAFSRFSTEHFDFHYREDPGKENTYFFHIRKKHHHAVDRNTIKRRIREVFRCRKTGHAFLIKVFLMKRMDLTDKKTLLEELNALFAKLS